MHRSPPNPLRALVALTLFATACAGCATAPSPTAASLPGVPRFGVVAPGVLERGGQPTDPGFASLRDHGVRTVIDLRRDHAAREGSAVAAAGMRYVNIPCDASAPREDQMAAFLAVALDPAAQPVFVHCHHGMDRTGTAVAVYRMAAQGWDATNAIRELRSYQSPLHAASFPQIAPFLRGLRPETLARGIRTAQRDPAAPASPTGLVQ